MSKKRKVVVTGGAGFIGSHLVEALLSRGYFTIVIDNLATGKLDNIGSVRKNPDLEFVEGTVTELPRLQNLFQGVDYVFHLAAIPGVSRSIEDPLAAHHANVNGTLNVLLAARDGGVKKVVFASSAAVYGETPAQTQTEDMAASPMSPYAVTKYTGEQYCRVFQRVYGLPTVSLRYFNVYGPRQDPQSDYAAAIPKFIMKVARRTPPVIYGDGEQTRDFIYVKDVCAVNILMAEGRATGVFNIGTGQGYTVNHLARTIIRLMGAAGIEPEYGEPRAGDILHSCADISRAVACGYRPQYSLEEGLRETVDEFRRGG
ncbi:MAG: SDR family oxidoreductase [Chloroflexota bacterium]